jgi:hypothetical protein
VVAVRIHAPPFSEPSYRPAQGRKGFSSEVKAELEALQHYYFEHLSRLPALLWNAVPINPPRIPERVFAPHAETAEIDILPL